ncbi:MAG: hypothetical protein ACOX52_08420 [Verrucomicrobiota bacterium]
MDHSIGPTHPHGLVENAAAPSAGGSPDGYEEGMLGKRLPFRSTSCPTRTQDGNSLAMDACIIGEHMTATAETMESPNHRNRQA